MNNVLASEFEYYIAHLDDFVSKYNEKYIVLKNEKVLGAYDKLFDAINEINLGAGTGLAVRDYELVESEESSMDFKRSRIQERAAHSTSEYA